MSYKKEKKRDFKYVSILCSKFIFFVFFILTAGNSFSQQSKKDSLLLLLKTDRPDTNKVIHSNKLCLEYKKIGRYDSALLFGNSALQLAQELNFKKGLVGSYGNLGNVLYEQGNYPKALEYYFNALQIAEELGRPLLKGEVCMARGDFYPAGRKLLDNGDLF